MINNNGIKNLDTVITFILSLVALVLGYFFYGRVVERVFGPDDRVTPAVAKADNMDYIVLPNWKIFMNGIEKRKANRTNNRKSHE